MSEQDVTPASQCQRLMHVVLVDNIPRSVEIGQGPSQSTDTMKTPSAERSRTNLPLDDGGRTATHRDGFGQRGTEKIGIDDGSALCRPLAGT